MRTRFHGVRWRTTVAATLAVAVFLAVAALVFAFAQRQQLEGSITEAARDQASDIAAQVAQDGAGAGLATGAGDQSLVQIVDAAGNVLAASPSVQGEPAVVDARPGPGATRTVRSRALPIGEGEEFVVVARGVPGPDGPVVVLVAESLELVGESTAVVANLLLIGYPVVLLGVALTSYWLAGRALAPVEAIRTRVAQVQGTSELDARVPVARGGVPVLTARTAWARAGPAPTGIGTPKPRNSPGSSAAAGPCPKNVSACSTSPAHENAQAPAGRAGPARHLRRRSRLRRRPRWSQLPRSRRRPRPGRRVRPGRTTQPPHGDRS